MPLRMKEQLTNTAEVELPTDADATHVPATLPVLSYTPANPAWQQKPLPWSPFHSDQLESAHFEPPSTAPTQTESSRNTLTIVFRASLTGKNISLTRSTAGSYLIILRCKAIQARGTAPSAATGFRSTRTTARLQRPSLLDGTALMSNN